MKKSVTIIVKEKFEMSIQSQWQGIGFAVLKCLVFAIIDTDIVFAVYVTRQFSRQLLLQKDFEPGVSTSFQGPQSRGGGLVAPGGTRPPPPNIFKIIRN